MMPLVVLLLLILLLVAVVKDPANALPVTLLMFGIEQLAQAHVPFLLRNSSFTNIYVACLVLLALVQRLRHGQQISSNISHGTLLLATMYIAHPISAVWAPDPDTTLKNFLQSAPYIIVLTFLPSLAVRGVDDLGNALRTFWFLGSILLVLIMTTGDFASRGVILEKLSRGRVSVANPLALSQVAGAVAIIAGVLPLWKGKLGQLAAGCSVVLALYVCVRTGSRGQFVAAIVALAVAMAIQASVGTIRTLQALLVTACGIAIVVWLFTIATDQFGDRFTLDRMQTEYNTGRVAPSEGMFRVWAHAGPWAWAFGLGGSSSYHYIGFYPHVVPMEVLTELGSAGILLYLGFAILAITRARWLLGIVSRENKDIIVCACALFGYEWILACKQGALLAADFMMCHGLIVCGIAQTWKLRQQADEGRWPQHLLQHTAG